MRQFAVIGLGRFGASVARTLSSQGAEVLAIDMVEEQVQEANDYATQAVQLDATDEKALRSVGIKDVDVAIVSIGQNIEASILVTMLLKEIGVKEIIAKAITGMHGKVLRQVGVSRVVFPERDMGVRLARNLGAPNCLDQFELLPDYSIMEVVAPKEFAGKTLRDINIRRKLEVSIIAIKKKVPTVDEEGETDIKEEMKVLPHADDIIEDGDILIIIGSNKSIQEMRKNK